MAERIKVADLARLYVIAKAHKEIMKFQYGALGKDYCKRKTFFFVIISITNNNYFRHSAAKKIIEDS